MTGIARCGARLMLVVDGLEAAYGLSQVLFGVTLRVDAGRLVTLLGRNGMGKTTTVRAIMGLLPVRAGRVRFEDTPLDGCRRTGSPRPASGWCPRAGRSSRTSPCTRTWWPPPATPAGERAVDARARLRAVSASGARARSLGGTLSGGEQQMLAIGRALMTNPQLLILDEATEGLAPLVRAEIWRCLAALKAAGLSILLIDKNVEALTRLADRHYVLRRGGWCGTARRPSCARSADVQHRYLGV